ncbi:hypothetical protein [Gottfriedia acidiceleris]|uniref:hypothetical protein n=1 Tax=Gottfriedia acidiceleris TaxID=371036 RepID=UPI003D1D9493
MKLDLINVVNLFDTKTIIVVFNGEKNDHFFEQIEFEQIEFEQIEFEEIDVDEFEEE